MKKSKWIILVLVLTALAIIGKIVGPQKKQIEPKKEATKQEQFKKLFSTWDGECNVATKAIKAAMNNPKSYEHVRTNYKIIAPDSLFADVLVQCRGTNVYNAIVTNNWAVKIDYNGNVHKVTLIN